MSANPADRRYRYPHESDPPVGVGKLHRALADIELFIYKGFDKEATVMWLLEGSVFRPQEPIRIAKGFRACLLPVDLGESAQAAGLPVGLLVSHYVSLDEFFARCERCDYLPDDSATAGVRVAEVMETAETRPAPLPDSPAFPERPTRAWKLPTGDYLLAGSEQRWPVPWADSVRLPDGPTLAGWTRYWVYAPDGKKVVDYPAPRDFCLDDYAYMVDLHAVTAGQLRKFLWREKASGECWTEVVAVVLDGLVESAVGELPFAV